jgi:hypothetical protein
MEGLQKNVLFKALKDTGMQSPALFHQTGSEVDSTMAQKS